MTCWRQEIYAKAYKFASHVHNGLLLPGTDLPYIVHVTLVTMEVIAALQYEKNRDSELAIQCALLHDVIEDTKITYDQVKETFGLQVADGVLALSKDETLEKTNRMADSLNRIREQPHEIWMVKMADRITNLHPPFPTHWDVKRIDLYRKEAQTIHDALAESSPYLSKRMETIITNSSHNI